MKVLITAGPTQEPIDDVRYVTNSSSGKMGAALALEAMAKGHDVTLIHGPVSIALPSCKKLPVTTAQQMLDAVMSELQKGYGIMISAAAVADFSPEKVVGKIRSGSALSLEMKPTPKIIDLVREAFPDLFLVAFKAEVGISREQLKGVAKEFLKRKGLQMVVANDVEKGVFGTDENDIVVATKGSVKDLGKRSKAELAGIIWNEIELLAKRG